MSDCNHCARRADLEARLLDLKEQEEDTENALAGIRDEIECLETELDTLEAVA